MSKRNIAIVLAFCLLGGAGADEPATPPAHAMAASTAEARQLAARFQAELLAELTAAMAQGPAYAVATCRDKAPAIASRLSRESGWQVKRVSLRVRNPLSGTADAWEQAQLLEFEARVAAGADPAMLETFSLKRPVS